MSTFCGFRASESGEACLAWSVLVAGEASVCECEGLCHCIVCPLDRGSRAWDKQFTELDCALVIFKFY